MGLGAKCQTSNGPSFINRPAACERKAKESAAVAGNDALNAGNLKNGLAPRDNPPLSNRIILFVSPRIV